MKYHYRSAFLLACFIFATPFSLFARGEPTIAPEIGRLIAEQGVDAGQVRFDELSESDSLDAGVEIEGLHTLMTAYMQAGNHAAADPLIDYGFSGSFGNAVIRVKKADAGVD